MNVLAALLPTLGPLEMVLLLVVILIFFGVGKLPEVGKALGSSLKSFKDAQRGDALDVTSTTHEIEDVATPVDAPVAAPVATPVATPATVVEKESV